MHKVGQLLLKVRHHEGLLPGLLTCVSLLFIWAFSLRGAFAGDGLFALYEDNEFLLGPVVSGISHMYSKGILPLRLDTILGGFPVYSFTQATPFYPFYGFCLDIFNGYLQTVRSLHWLTLAHVLLLLVNMNFLLRRLGLDRISAIAGATLFTFGADMFVYSMWLNILAPYAWLPLYIAGMLGMLEGQAPRKNVAIVTFSMLMMVTSSPSQPLIHAVFLTMVMFLGYALHCARQRMLGQLVKPALTLAATAVVCFLIAAPLLLPILFEGAKMIRWIGDFPAIRLDDKIPFDAFVFYRFHLADAWQILFNKSLGMVGSAYVGFFAIPLVALAFLERKYSWLVVVLAVIGGYALLSSFGPELGLAYLNYRLPLLDRIREPSRFLAVFQFCVAVLSSFGLANLYRVFAEEKSDPGRARRLLAVSAVVVIASFIIAWFRIPMATGEYIRFIACVILLVSTLYLLRHEFALARTIVALLWPIAIVASLFTAVQWQPPLRLGDSKYVQSGFAPLDMAIARVAKLDPASRHRLIFDGDFGKGYAGMLASYRGVRTFNYYINPAPIQQAVDFSYDYSPYYAYEGAAFLICKQCDLSKYKSFEYLESYGEFDLYRDPNAYPRVYIGSVAGNFVDTVDFIGKVKDQTPGIDRKVYVENGSFIGSAPVGPGKKCSLTTSSSGPTRQDLLVDCEPGRILVLNEYHDGNWVGSINGARVEVLKVNGNQNGIVLTDKAQFVTFEYRPILFMRSLALTLLGLVSLLALLFSVRPKR